MKKSLSDNNFLFYMPKPLSLKRWLRNSSTLARGASAGSVSLVIHQFIKYCQQELYWDEVPGLTDWAKTSLTSLERDNLFCCPMRQSIQLASAVSRKGWRSSEWVRTKDLFVSFRNCGCVMAKPFRRGNYGWEGHQGVTRTRFWDLFCMTFARTFPTRQNGRKA